MATTTAPKNPDLNAARRLFRTDWDENGSTAVHLPSAIASQLLEARDWTRQSNGRWNAPDGLFFTWDVGEALALALAAEVL